MRESFRTRGCLVLFESVLLFGFELLLGLGDRGALRVRHVRVLRSSDSMAVVTNRATMARLTHL